MSADLVKAFVAIGLSEQKAKETLKNESVTQNLKSAIEQVRQDSMVKWKKNR